MHDYIGKICPFCKTEITERDEVVLCSSCEMPHHKECWIENQGCTTFGCTGTIKSVPGPAAEAPRDFVFCTACGKKNAGDSLFCDQCGNRLTTPATPAQPAFRQNPNPYGYSSAPQSQSTPHGYQTAQNANPYGFTPAVSQTPSPFGGPGGTLDPDATRLIGVKPEYYLPQFQQMIAQNKKTSWNWVAFLFAPYWLIYRKMYAYGAIAFAVAFLIALTGSTFMTFLSIGLYAVAGVFANFVYMHHIQSLLSQTKILPEPHRSEFIEKNGGVNLPIMILSALAYAILVILFVW